MNHQVDHAALLSRFQPQLKYDSQEAFFADSAEEWTDNPGNVLRRTGSDGRPGELIAAATPAAGERQLSISFLGDPSYLDGTAAVALQKAGGGDQIGARSRRDYRKMYVELRTERYRNRMYGRAKEDSEGRLWLQYWFFYFYNDYNLAGGFGLHEGDWEMVQFLMGAETPELAVYAQHRQAEQASWEEVETLDGNADTPVVYVARGSHASYFRAGYHETEAWYDLADGQRETPKLELQVVADADPAWVAWRGRWGDTRPRIPDLEQPSPTAPCLHSQWDDPKKLLDDARTLSPPRDGRAPPEVEVGRVDRRLVIALDFSAEAGRIERLVVTVNSRDEPMPPRTFTFALDQVLRGRIETRIELDPAKYYDVRVSSTDPEGRPSQAKLHPIGPVSPRPPLGRRLLLDFGHAVAVVQRALTRTRKSKTNGGANDDARTSSA